MGSLLGIAKVAAFPGVMILWTLATVAALRLFRIQLPFSFPFHFYTRRERELHAALKGIPKGIYILISGLLLFACPFLAGLTAFDYFSDRYIFHLTYSLNSLVVSVVGCTVCGVWAGISSWKKSTQQEIGPAA